MIVRMNESFVTLDNYLSMEDTNDHYMSVLTPHIVILGFYILTGIIGNSLVVYIYLRKMSESTDSRFFIPCLAVADIFASIICGVSSIFLSVKYLTFSNDIGCKIIWFSMTATASGAAMILVFIAYHRYKKICKLFKQSRLIDKKFLVIAFIYLISFLISSPVIVTSGVTSYNYSNQTLYSCDRICQNFRTDMKYNIAIIYTSFEALVVIALATVMTVIYIKVGLKLYLHFKFTNVLENRVKVLVPEEECSKESMASTNSHMSIEFHVNKPSDSSTERMSNQIKRKKEKFNKQHKYTYIFITISVVCIVTYTPRLILMIIETAKDDFWLSFHDNAYILPFLKFLDRFFIVNNIANPFLYAMFDPKFKQKLIRIFRFKKNKVTISGI